MPAVSEQRQETQTDAIVLNGSVAACPTFGLPLAVVLNWARNVATKAARDSVVIVFMGWSVRFGLAEYAGPPVPTRIGETKACFDAPATIVPSRATNRCTRRRYGRTTGLRKASL
jgi:hypothetical protein